MVHGVTVVYRVGEDEQTAMEGFEDSGAETLLGVEVKKSEPVTRTITTKTLDRLRFTFGVQSLVSTSTKGDRNPTSVQMLIQFRRDGLWRTERDITITGENDHAVSGIRGDLMIYRPGLLKSGCCASLMTVRQTCCRTKRCGQALPKSSM